MYTNAHPLHSNMHFIVRTYMNCALTLFWSTMMCEIELAQLEAFVHILHSLCFWPRSRSQL